MANHFIKLYDGETRKFIVGLSKLSKSEARCRMAERYNSEVRNCNNLYFVLVYLWNDKIDEIRELIEMGYYKTVTDNVDDGLYLDLTDKYKNYLEMENDFENRQVKIQVDAQGNTGNINIAGGNASNITQTVNVSAAQNEILTLLAGMKESLGQIDDEELRGSISDDLDIVTEQVRASAPNVSRLKRAWERIQEAIKGATTATTLLIQLNTLVPLIADWTRIILERV